MHYSCGQLHRDLKPGNFLISHRGDVKVADLGILCQLDDRRASSQLPGVDADRKAKRPTDRPNDKSAPLRSISSDREIEREIESARERERTAQGEKKRDGAQQIKGTDAIIRERTNSRKRRRTRKKKKREKKGKTREEKGGVLPKIIFCFCFKIICK